MRSSRLIRFVLVIIFMSGCIQSFCQEAASDTLVSLSQVNDKYYSQVNARLGLIEEKLDKKCAKALQQFSKQEQKLLRKLSRLDSNAARQLLSNAKEKYAGLQQQLKGPQKITQFVPYLDTLKTSLKFLSQANGINDKLQSSLDKVNGLESELQKAEQVRQFLKARKQFLKEQLSKFGFAKDLMKLNKQVYYFSAQVNEFKEAIKDRKKAERKLIELLSKTKFFREFMQRNSMLAGMFRMPGYQNDPANLQAILSGLQTRTQVQQLLQQQISVGGPNAMAQVQQNIAEARTHLDKLKDKINAFRSGGSGGDMPDFRPNNQKTKPFLHRLELGANIQTSKGSNLFPITTDLGFSAGYKLNDKSTLGLGLSYKIGWGQGWRDIDISHQGVGLRSFLDWKLKGSFSMTGGYEMNYRTQFTRLEQLRHLSSWQQSGLAGLSKVVSIRSKFFKKTKLQLLFDFLSFQQVPRTQPLLFRVGYNF